MSKRKTKENFTCSECLHISIYVIIFHYISCLVITPKKACRPLEHQHSNILVITSIRIRVVVITSIAPCCKGFKSHQMLNFQSLWYAYLSAMQKHLLESMLKIETKFSSDKPCTPNHPVQRQAPEALPLALLLRPGNAEAVCNLAVNCKLVH